MRRCEALDNVLREHRVDDHARYRRGGFFDVTDGYYWALIPLIGVYLSAALVFVVIRAPRRETGGSRK